MAETRERLAALLVVEAEARALCERLHGQDVIQRLAIALDLAAASAPREAEDAPPNTLLIEARAEADRARRLFPQPNPVTLALAEEAGEVVKAVLHVREGKGTVAELRKELVQTIAMCIRLAEEGDPTVGVPPSVGKEKP